MATREKNARRVTLRAHQIEYLVALGRSLNLLGDKPDSKGLGEIVSLVIYDHQRGLHQSPAPPVGHGAAAAYSPASKNGNGHAPSPTLPDPSLLDELSGLLE